MSKFVFRRWLLYVFPICRSSSRGITVQSNIDINQLSDYKLLKTERRVLVVSTVNFGFRCRPGDRLSRLKFFVVPSGRR